MIAYFPVIYQDELVYSLLSRFYNQSGYIAYTYAAEDIYTYKNVRPDHEFFNVLHPKMYEIITKFITMEELVEKHTMYPYYSRFMEKSRKTKAFEALVTMNGNYRNLLIMPTKKDKSSRFLRYCPACVKGDRKRFGETYWHRSHQLIGVEVCPFHKCRLVNSSILISAKTSPSLIAAEKVVPYEEVNSVCDNLLELRLAEYILQVFYAPIDIHSDIKAGRFLHSKLIGTKYVSDSSVFRNLVLFYDDYLNFYNRVQGKKKMELFKIQKIFNDYRFNTNEICELAFFLNIPSQELVNRKLPAETHPMDKLYRHLAEKLVIDYDSVKIIGNEVLKIYHSNLRVQQKCGPKVHRWDELDEELLPKVKDIILELYDNAKERPNKVTPYLITRKLGLPDKRLKKLPMCNDEILKYQETQQQYWAREVLWAFKKINDEKLPLNWRQIRNLTNMRRINFDACLSCLDEFAKEEIVERIKML